MSARLVGVCWYALVSSLLAFAYPSFPRLRPLNTGVHTVQNFHNIAPNCIVTALTKQQRDGAVVVGRRRWQSAVFLANDVMMDVIYSNSRVGNSRDDLDLNDFELVLDAIYVFSKVNGDCHVPVKFEVPSEDPWPQKLHGMQLGKRLKKLLSSQDFFQNHKEKVAAIRELGMEPSLATMTDDWSSIISAMRHYKSVYGTLRVPSKFVVPNSEEWPRLARGLKLGVRVAAIRSAGRYVKDHPERKQELDELEFEWRLREVALSHGTVVGAELFEYILEALTIYRDHVDDKLIVGSTFVIPSQQPWPEHLWKMSLGSMVASIRDRDSIVADHPEREERLTKLGFLMDESGRALFSKKRFDMVYAALVTYKELYGNMFVPQAFVVPGREPWPEITWGVKLGARVNAIRSQGTLVANSPERREMLDNLGFTWELPSHIKREKRRKDAAAAEAEAKGEILPDGDIPDVPVKEYIKPGPKPTPYELTDVPVVAASSSKKKESSISASAALVARWPFEDETDPTLSDTDRLAAANAAQNRISDLKLPGKLTGERRSALNFDPTRLFEPDSYREVAAEALRLYTRDREYSADPDIRQWSHFEGHMSPESFHTAISRSFAPEDVRWMKATGYRILEFGRFCWDDVEQGLHIYKAHFGNVDVPLDFVVDEAIISQGIGFTEQMEDLALGEAVAGLRIGDIDGLEDPVRRKVLDSLDFDWGDKSKYQRYRFVPMLLGLKLYKHLHGFALPQSDFVVPDEPQWPFWMAHMPLGEWAAVVRVQQKMVEEHYPARRDMLNALEFLWWIPPGNIKDKYFKPVR